MFERPTPRSRAHSGFQTLDLIYHATVRSIRKSHGNPLIGLIMNVMTSLVMVVAFYVMFSVLGLRGNAIRGDFLLYIMSGIFLFLTHTKAIGAVFSAEGPASPMMQHAPMNTFVAIASAALGSLYIQLLSMFLILFGYHVAFTPFTVHKPMGALGMVILAWFSGVAIGMVFRALKPFLPSFTSVAQTVYQRANMIASGKMFVANQMPGYILVYFTWNPLFHAIDQARGFTFINYNPHFSSIEYPLYLSIGLVLLGLMGDFYGRKVVSMSWEAER